MAVQSSAKPPRAGVSKDVNSVDARSSRTARKAKQNSGRALITKLFKAAKILVVGHVHVKREGKNIHIVLQERIPEKAEAPAEVKDGAQGEPLGQEQTSRQELLAMQNELAEVLNHHPGTRTTLRHLAIFEKKFKQSGLEALNKLPIELLQKALHQLDTLCAGVAPPAVVKLRSKIEIAMMEREPLDVGPPTVAALSDFNVPERLQVAEVGESDFMRAREQFVSQGKVKAA